MFGLGYSIWLCALRRIRSVGGGGDTSGDNWILADGTWNDSGIWIDGDTWNDS